MLNIQPDSCLITSSDTGMKEYIHIRNEKRIFSSLSPEGENWAGARWDSQEQGQIWGKMKSSAFDTLSSEASERRTQR